MAEIEQLVLEELYGVRWENLRSFADTGILEMESVTVILGANNAGKTSLFLPFLLLKQTVESKDDSIGLLLRGPIVDAGTFQDLVHMQDPEKTLGLTFYFARPEALSESTRPLGEEPPDICELHFTAHASVPTAATLSKFVVKDRFGRRMLERARQPDGHYTLTIEIPTKATTSRPSSDTKGDPISRLLSIERVVNAVPKNFVFDGISLLSQHIMERLRKEGVDPSTASGDDVRKALDGALSKEFVYYAATVGRISDQVMALVKHVDYIGPLRAPPLRTYDRAAENPVSIGPRGESAPQLLARRSDILPQVGYWMRQLKLATAIAIQDKSGGDQFSIVVRRSDSSPWINLVDSGFGVSQVLPLLVQSCLEGKSSVIIAEQPELHLNPRQQSVLADLVPVFVESEQNLLIETHSEHFLLRLRTLIAQGRLPQAAVVVYFVEKADESSNVKRVEIDALGHIRPDSWPKGFFEDGLREAMTLAYEQAKRRAT